MVTEILAWSFGFLGKNVLLASCPFSNFVVYLFLSLASNPEGCSLQENIYTPSVV